MNSGFVGASTNPAAKLAPKIADAAEDLAGLEPVKTLKSRWPMILVGGGARSAAYRQRAADRRVSRAQAHEPDG